MNAPCSLMEHSSLDGKSSGSCQNSQITQPNCSISKKK
jgi:hypothetical protein